MSFNYDHYSNINVTLESAQWMQGLYDGTSRTTLGWTTEMQKAAIDRLLLNSFTGTSTVVMSGVDEKLQSLISHMNQTFSALVNKINNQEEVIKEAKMKATTLELLLGTQNDLLRQYKTQLDQIPMGQNAFQRPRVPEPPNYQGRGDKSSYEDWMSQMALFNAATGVTTDHQRIVNALLRLKNPAQRYMKSYYKKNEDGEDLGTYEDFKAELKRGYGIINDKQQAQVQLEALWANTKLASTDFLAFVEEYRQLGRLTDYSDEHHYDKLILVLPSDVKAAMVHQDMKIKETEEYPAWDNYLDVALEIYKYLHAGKLAQQMASSGHSKGKGNNNNGGGRKDPNSMEVDAQSMSKGKGKDGDKPKKFCQICAGKGKTRSQSTHNTVDCFDKPGNEGKRPPPKNTSTSSSGNTGNKNFGKKRTLQARIAELMKEYKDDDDTASPAGTVEVNTARIEELSDSESSEKATSSSVDETRTSPSRMRRSKVDFPQGL